MSMVGQAGAGVQLAAVNWTGRRGCPKGLCSGSLADTALDLFAASALGSAKIVLTLQIHPQLGRNAKIDAETKSCIRGDGACAAQDETDAVGRDV